MQFRTSDSKTVGAEATAAVMIESCRNQRRAAERSGVDWLASESAETAIDWRVDSAWLLAASSLESARVRLDEPVCSTLIRFFREVLTDLHDREVGAEGRSLRAQRRMLAVLSAVRTLVAELIDEVGAVRATQAETVRIEGHAWIVEVDLPVSLNTSFSVSPLSRLTPLKDES